MQGDARENPYLEHRVPKRRVDPLQTEPGDPANGRDLSKPVHHYREPDSASFNKAAQVDEEHQ